MEKCRISQNSPGRFKFIITDDEWFIHRIYVDVIDIESLNRMDNMKSSTNDKAEKTFQTSPQRPYGTNFVTAG